MVAFKALFVIADPNQAISGFIDAIRQLMNNLVAPKPSNRLYCNK